MEVDTSPELAARKSKEYNNCVIVAVITSMRTLQDNFGILHRCRLGILQEDHKKRVVNPVLSWRGTPGQLGQHSKISGLQFR